MHTRSAVMWAALYALLACMVLCASAQDSVSVTPPLIRTDNSDFEEGMATLKRRFGEDFFHHECWDQVSRLVLADSCRHLSYANKAKVALALTNCHLVQSGLPRVPCALLDDPLLEASELNLKECVTGVSEDSFASSAYNTFFVHVDHLCFQIHREFFQHSSERAIAGLFEATVSTERSVDRIHGALENSHQSLQNLERAASRGFASVHNKTAALASQLDSEFVRMQGQQTDLFDTVRASRQEVQLLANDTQQGLLNASSFLQRLNEQSHATEQRIMSVLFTLKDTLTRLWKLDSSILSQIFRISSFFFYLPFGVLFGFLTAVKRTNAARFPLYVLMFALLCIERALPSYLPTDYLEWYPTVCAYLRQIFLGVAVVMLVVAYVSYRDYSALSYHTIVQAQQKLHKVSETLNTQLSLWHSQQTSQAHSASAVQVTSVPLQDPASVQVSKRCVDVMEFFGCQSLPANTQATESVAPEEDVSAIAPASGTPYFRIYMECKDGQIELLPRGAHRPPNPTTDHVTTTTTTAAAETTAFAGNMQREGAESGISVTEEPGDTAAVQLHEITEAFLETPRLNSEMDESLDMRTLMAEQPGSVMPPRTRTRGAKRSRSSHGDSGTRRKKPKSAEKAQSPRKKRGRRSRSRSKTQLRGAAGATDTPPKRTRVSGPENIASEDIASEDIASPSSQEGVEPTPRRSARIRNKRRSNR